jgi:poly-gamma-glutamate capsule biosynthesis protein CapA/YwtB (metallophosphatase superfamily)
VASRPAPPQATGAAQPERPAADPARTVTISAVGDTVMGSPPYGLPPDGGASFFTPVADLIAADVALVNMEGTFATSGASKCGAGSSSCFAFRTPPSYAKWLRRAGFTMANLANNHSYDFGAIGQRQTITALRGAGVIPAGLPGQVATQDVEGVRVAVVGFCAYREWCTPATDLGAARRLVQKAAREADVVIATGHLGAEGSAATTTPTGTEYFLGENRGDSRALARTVVDAGADLVVFHGPHVLRGMEFRKGRLIAYSMGNFAGYRVFGLGGPLSTSGVLRVTLGADGRFVSGRLAPTQLVGAGTPAPGGDGVALVSRLSRQDFGATAARLAPGGAIRPPGA